MEQRTIQDGKTQYRRINKRQARQLWGEEDIALCPIQYWPGKAMSLHTIVTAQWVQDAMQSVYMYERERATFDAVVRAFESDECTGSAGSYAAFYRVERREA